MAENNHIEEFFRKRLGSHEFNFQEEDWLKLERKLEISGVSASQASFLNFSIRTVIIIIAGLTAAFIMGWLASELVQDKKNSREQHRDLLPVNESPETNIQKTVPKLAVVNPVKSRTSEKGQNVEETIQQQAETEDVPPAHFVEQYNQPTEQNGVITGVVETAKNIRYELIPLHSTENINSMPVNLSHELPALSFSESSVPFSAPVSAGRWSVGFIVAPDYNSVGINRGKTLSPAIGGIVSYRISPRWSLSARILYNNKKYKSQSDYYNVPDDYWPNRTNGIIPDNISGSCRVIDVPVLLSYRFLQRRIFSFTASAGLGSYFLLDEKYEFSFSQDNPGAATEWETKDNSNMLFNIANFAIGMEMQSSRRTSIAIEPYLKVPLKQMGWGKVNLSGMGLSLSVKYHF